MKILIAHNRYQYAGGEDKVVSSEAAMLQRGGHTVEQLAFDNDAIGGVRSQVGTALQAFFSPSAYRRVKATLGNFQPDILHVHNFMPTLSPAVFFAGQRSSVPVVQTLHNYRLLCAKGTLYREGKPCERCIDEQSFLPGIASACYRGSRLGSAVIGGTMALHASLGTWQTRINRYIALTNFAATKLQHRVPGDLLRVKPNFVPDHGVGSGHERVALFVGRLSEEKGIRTLLTADRAHRLELPVTIIGDGPLRNEVEQAVKRPGSRLTAIGHQESAKVIEHMQRAAVLLVPSDCYEGFPVSVVEAFCVGLPVIASRLGSLPEIVSEEICGFLHRASDASDLARVVAHFASLTPGQIATMRGAVRSRYMERYSESSNHAQLISIYAEAIASAATRTFSNSRTATPQRFTY